jgi:hypothetical protein
MLASAPKGLARAVPRVLGVTCEHRFSAHAYSPNPREVKSIDARTTAGCYRYTTCADVREMAWARSVRVVRLAPVRSLDLRGRMRSQGANLPSHEGTYTRPRHTMQWGKSPDRRGMHAVLSPSERLLLLRNGRLVGLSPEDRQLWLLTCGRRFNRATSTYRRPFLRPGDKRQKRADRPPGGQGGGLRPEPAHRR